MDSVIPLTSLKVGEMARIVSINARGELARRIRDMGLGSGMPVSVVGYAPLRDPLALRCAEVTIALRRREAGSPPPRQTISARSSGLSDVCSDALLFSGAFFHAAKAGQPPAIRSLCVYRAAVPVRQQWLNPVCWGRDLSQTAWQNPQMWRQRPRVCGQQAGTSAFPGTVLGRAGG